MNLIHNPFIRRQIKDNAIYLFLSVGLIISFIVSIFIFINKQVDNSDKTMTLENDIQMLKTKVDFINLQAKIQKEGIDTDTLNKLLGALVPEEEDYFSIITALDTLSTKTGFLITSYSLDLSRSSPTKLSISVEGTGDQAAFLKFLDSYSFGGGRLITVDSIDYQTQGFFTIKLAVNFYSGKGEAVPETAIDLTEADKALLQKIQDKFTIDVLSSESQVASPEYATKSNPF